MSPRSLTDELVRTVPLLRTSTPVREAVEAIRDAEVPALPVVDDGGRLVGLFGEREFFAALFPAYLNQLGYAGFVPRSLESELQKRASSALEPVERHMNREHVDVSEDWSDAQVAEVFLHHRVLIVPVVHGGRVQGIITRADFFAALAQRFLEVGDESG